ncbi:glycosyltransferase [Dechloromonas sp. XY25]|uniref:Glycosyltransferase n=1 Tax=Dechloromonas hankyongensis TaxID=2908002 RepID=A0ABS9K1R1_9RHOO|nr:glycosyltransferase [Dechloromonas hankyongensis]MCG2577109.1 glycosyltransferase [Dechloromonas hankyongensis]
MFIITGLATGGAEGMLYKLLCHVDRSRFVPFVVSLTSEGEYGSRIAALDIQVHAMQMSPGLPNPVIFLKLAHVIHRLNPDVVQCWMYHADLLGGLAARFAGVKAISWGIRNTNFSREVTKLSTRTVIRACAFLSNWLPKKIVTCSEQARSAHIAIGYRADKFAVVPNGFDLSQFCPDASARASVRSELGLLSRHKIVGLVARYDPIKNHLGFLEAVEHILQCEPDVHFVLVGQNVDWSNSVLTDAIEKRGLRERCHLLGRRTDIPRLMASFDVLASSSVGEAFPNVLGEAMACGVLCVVTDVGDCAEIVGQTGVVAPNGDMAGLADGIVRLLALSPGERSERGEIARLRVSANYEIGSVTRRYESYFESLCPEINRCAV